MNNGNIKYAVRADEMACFLLHCGLQQNSQGVVSRYTGDTDYLQYGSASNGITLIFDFNEYVSYMTDFYQSLPITAQTSKYNIRIGGILTPDEAKKACLLYEVGQPEMLQRAFMGDLGLHIALSSCYENSFQYRWEGLPSAIVTPDVSAHLRRLKGNSDWQEMKAQLADLVQCFRLPYSIALTDETSQGAIAIALYASYASTQRLTAYPLWNWRA